MTPAAHLAPDAAVAPAASRPMMYLPLVTEQSPRGERTTDLYSRLLRERIVCLTGPVDEQSAAAVTAQLLFLESEDSHKPIHLYIQSPGGDAYAGLGIIDAMDLVRPPVSTIATGLAASAAALILACGTPGMRHALPHSTVMLHQPWSQRGGAATASDMRIQAQEMVRLREEMLHLLAARTGRSFDQIAQDTERDLWLPAEAARTYGLVDRVLAPARGDPAQDRGDIPA